MVVFIAREEKASWGFPCNQKADGTLWAGKGFKKTLTGQLGLKPTVEIQRALTKARGSRNGRFWVDFEERQITMAVGDSGDNKYDQCKF